VPKKTEKCMKEQVAPNSLGLFDIAILAIKILGEERGGRQVASALQKSVWVSQLKGDIRGTCMNIITSGNSCKNKLGRLAKLQTLIHQTSGFNKPAQKRNFSDTSSGPAKKMKRECDSNGFYSWYHIQQALKIEDLNSKYCKLRQYLPIFLNSDWIPENPNNMGLAITTELEYEIKKIKKMNSKFDLSPQQYLIQELCLLINELTVTTKEGVSLGGNAKISELVESIKGKVNSFILIFVSDAANGNMNQRIAKINGVVRAIPSLTGQPDIYGPIYECLTETFLDGNQLDSSIKTVNFHLIEPMISLLKSFCDKFNGRAAKPACYYHIESLIGELSAINARQSSKPKSFAHSDPFCSLSPSVGISNADTLAALTLMGMRSNSLDSLSQQRGQVKLNHGLFTGHESQEVLGEKSASSTMPLNS